MSQDAIVAILIIAIVVNVAIMAGLVLTLARRGRVEASSASLAAASTPSPAIVVSAPVEPAPEGEEIMPMEAPPAEPEPEEPAPEAAEEESLIDLLVDPLTGLDNRFGWDRLVREENVRRRRYGRPVSVVIAELAGLDALAERVGDDAADRLIPALAETMRRYGRAADHVCRVDHARFNVLLPETDEVRAINYVERVRQACDIWLEAGAVALSISMGWASPGPEDDLDTAMIMAETRLRSELRRGTRRAAG